MTINWALLLFGLLGLYAASAGGAERKEGKMDAIVVMKFNNEEIAVRMNDSSASADFLALLPLTLTFRDYAGTEKVSGLPERLSTSGSPAGHDPSVGDFTYYAPWGNLAVFYRDFHYSPGLVALGVIESGAEKLSLVNGDFSVRLEVRR